MTDVRLVLTTVDSREHADRLAAQMVERRLAACVNILGPVSSVYRWQGKIEHAEEFLLLIKTTAHRVEELAAALEQIHPYDLPEFLQVSIPAGSKSYLDWVVAEVESQ